MPVNDAHTTNDDIRLRAYQLYVERHGAPGDPVADWLRAERELTATPPAGEKRPNGRGRKIVRNRA